ncbi:MAG TPA: hypothetical protein PKD83_14495, partial [Ignavibacteria bacterium]|nr:hypothetical protein [Ignavibacteria bacterium]
GMGFTPPVWEYPHSGSFMQSITGGFVYRGSELPELFGKYIYADYIDGTIWSLDYDGINPTVNTQLFDTNFYMVSFGVDEQKELYVLSYAQISPGLGRIYKLVNKNVNKLSLKVAIQGFYDIDNDRLNIRDTCSVYLRTDVSPYNIIDSSKTVIDSLSLTGKCFFNNAQSGNYYIIIKHRNSMETWSRSSGDSVLRGENNYYDFTDNVSKAYGNNMALCETKYCIYSGDVIQDGFIEASDLSMVENDAYEAVNYYVNTDLNGDYFVDGSDISILETNIFNSVMLITP